MAWPAVVVSAARNGRTRHAVSLLAFRYFLRTILQAREDDEADDGEEAHEAPCRASSLRLGVVAKADDEKNGDQDHHEGLPDHVPPDLKEDSRHPEREAAAVVSLLHVSPLP